MILFGKDNGQWARAALSDRTKGRGPTLSSRDKNTLFDIFFAVGDQSECFEDKKMKKMSINK